VFSPATWVLIIDDMAEVRGLVVQKFKELGFWNLLEASDGAQAWEILERGPHPIRLIVSDWRMPNLTGLDLIRKVKGDSRFKDLPILMITMENESKKVLEALVSGADSYIIKPFSTEKLRSKLETIYQRVTQKK